LPLTEFPKVVAATAQAADRLALPLTLLRGRALKVADGSTVTVSDTPKNRKAYPPLQGADRPSFPMLRIVVLFSVLSGAISAVATGSWAASELALFSTLSSQLSRGDILLGDRGFGCYPFIAWLKFSLEVDFIGRTTRRVDSRRRRRRLGPNDWLILWKRRVSPSAWLSPLQWPGLPTELTPRAVKRKKNKYPRLNVPRRQFRDRPKRNVRRSRARLRRLGLM
jgi:hypothetical protein